MSDSDDNKKWHDLLRSEKQRTFVEAFLGEAKGNGSKAARIAGYACPKQQATENLSKPYIQEAIERYRESLPKRLSPEDIHDLWAQIANDPDEATGNRIKALRDAARSQAMFVERVRHEGSTELRFQIPDRDGDDDE